jgi:hypothetical protein
MRRRTLLAVLAGLGVVIAAGAVMLWPPPDRITLENHARIQVDMTLSEIEAILGGPPGDYRTVPTETDQTLPRRLTLAQNEALSEDHMFWHGNDLSIGISVDMSAGNPVASSKRILDVWTIQVKRVEQGPLANLLWRAQRQWHRWFPD